MGCEGRYVAEFLRYLSDFVANIRPDDPLPVRAPNYKVTESEIDGQILDIVHHYLNSRECPPYVREYVGHQVWTSIRNPEVNGEEADQLDNSNFNHTYDILKLIQDVTSKANTVIQEMQSTLTVDQVEKLPRYHPISHFAIKNGRRKMEDRHVIIHDLNTLYGLNYKQPHAYYGVFDGHAGIDAAVYSAAHLHQYMIQNPQYETNPEAALKHAFHITDTNFIKKASKEKLKGGTTAVVALVREKRLVVAWLGDSQALLVRRRSPVRMVEPHKPELPVERERVEEMGGCVLNIQGTWRVLGQLAVSRAIGDREYKPFVSSECDIKSLEIEGDEDFLILACDGLWDTLSPDAAVNLVYAYLTRNDGETDGVGRCLVEAARNSGSDDNITAVVVFLRPVSTIMEEEAQRIAQGQVPEPVPEAVLCKDSTPSSINAIFSPPVNQFADYNSDPPIYIPFDGEIPFKMDAEDAATPASQPLQKQEEPMEGSEAPQLPARDSDEGIPAAGKNDQAFNPHEAPTPTAEEVDAALAELDSIPDEVCESGDVEEEDEEEEEWSYYRMDLQTQPQGEDVLVPGSSEVMDQNQDKAGTPSADITQEQPKELETGNGLGGPSLNLMEDNHTDDVEIANQSSLLSKSPDLFQTEAAARLNKETNLMETSISNVGEYLDNYEPSSSPHAPGSPRSVEGFVTSVELNTPEEIGGVAHPQDVNGSGVEQSSGPFSVYVSSSPEPVSLDPHLQTSGDFDSVSELTNGQVGNEIEASGDFSPVEIVHAQSTVEVVASPTPSEKREGEMPEVPTSPTAPVNQTVDVTFIPEPAVEPTAEKPVPVFIDEGTPVSEGEPEIPSSVLADMHTSEPATADFLSREPSGELLVMKETCTAESPVPELQALVEGTSIPHDEAPTSEPMSPVFDTASPLMEETPVEAGVPSSMEPTLFNVSSTLEPSPALASPVEMTTTKPLSAPMSPVQEPSPAPMSPVQEPSPAPLSPVQEPSPAPLSPVHEPSPAPMSPVQEPSPTPMSPVQEPSPAPMSPVQEPSPAPMSPVQEPSPAPMSPVQEPSPVTISPIQEPSPAPAFPVEEPVPAPASPVEKPVPAPASPDEEPAPAPASPVQEPSPTPLSPVEEAIPTPVSLVEKPAVAPVSPVEEPAPTPVSTVEDPALITSLVTEPAQAPLSAVLDPSPVPEHAVEEEAPLTLSPVVLETQAGPPSVIPDIMETAAVNTGKDEIQINKGTVVIPVVAQDDVKETKPEVAKSPAKTAKTPGKAADKAGKQTPSKSTPGKATPTRTPSSRTPLTKPTEKKPTPSSQTLKSTSTRPAAEKTTAPRTRVTPTSSATSKQALTKPSTKPVARTTTAKPSTTTTTTKPAEKRAPKPATPTTPRAALSKPSAAPSKSAQSSTAGRATTTTTATKRPISAPTRRVEKTDTSKVNGTATKPSRTTTSRPATASTATRKPLSATARSVPEKETKNTTNRILSTTTKSVQKSSPGTARSVTSKATALAKTAGKVDGTSSATTTTSKARMTSVTKSSTTTKATGVTAKKTLVSKTSTTKSKTAAAATSSKVQKSEVILAPVTNGENKIAHEETSVEVIEKCAAEDVVQCSTTEQVISTETVEVIVNGDH